jgi:hypothetical protein
MPDALYEHDVLAWSQHQADLLRRLGRGERVNDVDWTKLAEEIEALGRSELRSVESLLLLMLVHLLKLQAWPDSDAGNHRRGEIVGFQYEANRRFTPSMRQKIDVGGLYAHDIRRLGAEAPDTGFPPVNPFALDDLLNEDWDTLLSRLPPEATA